MKLKHSPPMVVQSIFRASLAFGIAFSFLIVLASCFESGGVALAATTTPFVQSRDRQITSGTTNAVTFVSPTTAGNLIAAYVIWDSTGSVSISDSGGNTYVSAVGPTLWSSGRYSAQVFYAKNIRGGAATVTARFATAVKSFGIVYIHEYSQLDRVAPVDGTAAAVGSSGAMNSGSVAVTNPNALLFGAGVSANMVTSGGAGYTVRSRAQGNITEDRVVSAPGSYSATASHANGAWGMQLVAFRFAGSTPADMTPPTVPTEVSAVAVSPSQINLSWTASTDPTNTPAQLSYRVYRNGVLIATTAAGTTAWQNTGLQPSTTYTYAVSALDPSNNFSAQSTVVQATTPPLMPSIASFKATPGSIIAGQTTTLSWMASNATSMVIDNGVGTVAASSSIAANPAVTTTYILTATNSAGSATAQATVTVSPDVTPPSVPNLSAVAVSASQVNLSWTASTDNVGVAGYKVYRNGAEFAQTTSTGYSDTALEANTTYTYRVSAYDEAGNNSAPSAPVTPPAFGSDTQAPTVAISSPSNNQAVSGTWTITANASDNVGVTEVQFMLDGSSLGEVSLTPPYSTQWNTGQYPDGTHVLTAVARDAAGNSTTSAAVTVTIGPSSRRPYTTTFPLTENPISEGGQWINGKALGLDWADIRTTPGLAFGTQKGTVNYDDSTALLAGTWGPDQTVEATVHTVNQNDNIFEEVELRLRSSISAHRATGYEINFRCSRTSRAYTQIVRWNGPLGNFSYLFAKDGTQFGIKDGDVVKATIVGNVIKAYINGVLVGQATDNTFTSGNPGMGFYVQGGNAASVNGDFGFTSFTASDGSTTDTAPPSVPTSLSASAVSSSQINLSWTASTDDVGVLGYKIFQNDVQIATTATTSFSDTGLSAATEYTYAIAAYDGAGYVSPQTVPLTVTTPAPDITPPSVPVILQSANVTSTSLGITWTASTDDFGVAGYQVFRNGSLVGTTAVTNYTDSGLAPGTTYSYTVAAFDYSNNVAPESSAYQVTTSTAPLAPPSFVQSNHNQTARGGSTSVALNTPTIAGHTIVAYVIWDNTGTATLTDSRGDSFVAVSAPTIWAGKYSAQVFYATNIAGGTTTVTAAFKNAVVSFGVLYVHEYAGISAVNPVDVTAAASGSSASLNSGSVTTTSANDLIFGAGVSDSVVTAAGSGFAARDMAYGNITEDKIAGPAGSYSATATHNGKMWGMQLVAFRGAN